MDSAPTIIPKQARRKAVPTRTAAIVERRRASSRGATEPKPGDLVVVIDTREQHPYAFPGDVTVVVRALPAGDIAPLGAETRCAIDRKSLGDFIGCITFERERFERELEKLSRYDYAAIYVEAPIEDVYARRYRSQVSPAVIIGSAASIGVRYGAPVHFVGSHEAGADLAIRTLRSFHKHFMVPVVAGST